MDRTAAARVRDATVALLLLVLALGIVAALRFLPPVELATTELAWLPTVLAAVLVVTSATAALASLVDGIRHGDLRSLIGAGASAALTGGAVALLLGATSMSVALLGAALLMAAGTLAADTPRLDRRTSRWVAAMVMVLAEVVAVAELAPFIGELAGSLRVPILGAATGAAVLALAGSLAGGAATPLLLAVGAAGLLADRGGTFESVIAIGALIAAQLDTMRNALDSRPTATEKPTDTLPMLANRLAEAVLLFDGRLRLRRWNDAAGALLGLDSASAGARIEDLLGVTLPELPAADGATVTHVAIGGLEVVIHRDGEGLTAVIHDPGARTEADQLGRELRATIEELLQARRTIELQRAELERGATIDAITGVSSRSAIVERLRTEVAQSRRYSHPVAVVLLDVDGFGELNRLHGVAGGDGILREVALRMRLRVREADALGRAGSDSFLAVLPHTDDEGAARFADALRRRLALRPIAVGDDLVSVTVSIGVGGVRHGEDLDLDALLARVDEALQSARRHGGDRIALDRLHGLARLEDRRRREGDPEAEGGDAADPGSEAGGV